MSKVKSTKTNTDNHEDIANQKPKRPQGVFILFQNEHRDRIKTENPTLKYNSTNKNEKTIMSVLSETFQKLSKEEKDKYQAIYLKSVEEFKKELDKYNQLLESKGIKSDKPEKKLRQKSKDVSVTEAKKPKKEPKPETSSEKKSKKEKNIKKDKEAPAPRKNLTKQSKK